MIKELIIDTLINFILPFLAVFTLMMLIYYAIHIITKKVTESRAKSSDIARRCARMERMLDDMRKDISDLKTYTDELLYSDKSTH